MLVHRGLRPKGERYIAPALRFHRNGRYSGRLAVAERPCALAHAPADQWLPGTQRTSAASPAQSGDR